MLDKNQDLQNELKTIVDQVDTYLLRIERAKQ